MSALEEISEKKHCFFVDLFVRVSNSVAINMYKALGYTIYRYNNSNKGSQVYRVAHRVANLGWVDLNFDYSTVCLILPELEFGRSS